MRMQFEVVCTNSRLTDRQREEQRLQVIGEILPFVLAKYGRQPDPREAGSAAGNPAFSHPFYLRRS